MNEEESVPPAEPTRSALSNPALRYFVATRPPFLIVTFFAALIGIASADYSGLALAPLPAVITVIFALVAHAGINVLNDYYDELNGTDRINTERVFPFTGGSRFIATARIAATAAGVRNQNDHRRRISARLAGRSGVGYVVLRRCIGFSVSAAVYPLPSCKIQLGVCGKHCGRPYLLFGCHAGTRCFLAKNRRLR